MDHNTISRLTNSFDALARQAPDENTEFWYAREIMTALGYDRWENFSKVVHKASIACETAGGAVSNHFRGVTKMVSIGSGAERPVEDIMLTRYACCLIAQNGDPRKEAIAEALTASQHEINLLKQLTERYKAQKRGLMQKMLTGDWRVKPEIVNHYMEA